MQEVETKQADASAKAYALEADLFSTLAKLSDRTDATAHALGQQLDSLGQAVIASQEDSATRNRTIETLASGSGPAAAPAGQADH